MSTLNDPPGIPEPNDYGDTKPSDDGKSVGDALASFDFAHTDTGPADLDLHGPEPSDAHAALVSMSCDDALDYAISHMGPADHLDVGHIDMPADASHDT